MHKTITCEVRESGDRIITVEGGQTKILARPSRKGYDVTIFEQVGNEVFEFDRLSGVGVDELTAVAYEYLDF